jgi:hypothetical protein
MASKRFSFTAILLLLFLAPLPAVSETLPDAPGSGQSSEPSPAHASEPHAFATSKWYGVVDPGEKVPPFYSRDKMMFWLHEEITPVGWVPVFFSSGWEQLINGDPKYGSDSAAFGERLGASALRVTSYRFFSDSLLPTLTREDPRYFRKAYGSPQSRSAYAARRVFVARRDNNSEGFNYSDFFGHLAGAALTAAYYPSPSANARVVMTSWGISLAGDAGGKLFLEFWPDVRDAIFHRHKNKP